jgi:hypothetical protein
MKYFEDFPEEDMGNYRNGVLDPELAICRHPIKIISMLKQNILALSLLSISSAAFSQSTEWILPKVYSDGSGVTANGYTYVIQYDKNAIYFSIALKEQLFPWITKCARTQPKGILETRCTILPADPNQKDENNISIFFDQTRPIIIFKPVKSVQVNYKIDSQPIVSLRDNYFLNVREQRSLLGDLERGSKITYAFKETDKSSFKTKTHDLSGVGYHIDFSKEFVRLNN